jgi:hypothetical protein
MLTVDMSPRYEMHMGGTHADVGGKRRSTESAIVDANACNGVTHSTLSTHYVRSCFHDHSVALAMCPPSWRAHACRLTCAVNTRVDLALFSNQESNARCLDASCICSALHILLEGCLPQMVGIHQCRTCRAILSNVGYSFAGFIGLHCSKAAR